MAEIDKIGLVRFNLDAVDIKALEALRDKALEDMVLNKSRTSRRMLSRIWNFYNCACNGYYLGKQLNMGIPLLNCKVENK